MGCPYKPRVNLLSSRPSSHLYNSGWYGLVPGRYGIHHDLYLGFADAERLGNVPINNVGHALQTSRLGWRIVVRSQATQRPNEDQVETRLGHV